MSTLMLELMAVSVALFTFSVQDQAIYQLSLFSRYLARYVSFSYHKFYMLSHPSVGEDRTPPTSSRVHHSQRTRRFIRVQEHQDDKQTHQGRRLWREAPSDRLEEISSYPPYRSSRHRPARGTFSLVRTYKDCAVSEP